jgi:anti-sigma B factor antagonist
MNLTSHESNGAMVIAPSGEVDLQHSPRLRKTLMDLMLDRRDVVVDLSAVAYIDSSGIAALVEAYQMARRNGGLFTLAAISGPALRVLKLARLDRVFTIADTVDLALSGPATAAEAP